MNLNKNYDNLEQSYLFSTIAKKVNEYTTKHPEKKSSDLVLVMLQDLCAKQ